MIQDLSTQDKREREWLHYRGWERHSEKKKGEGGRSLSLIAKSWYEGVVRTLICF